MFNKDANSLFLGNLCLMAGFELTELFKNLLFVRYILKVGVSNS